MSKPAMVRLKRGVLFISLIMIAAVVLGGCAGLFGGGGSAAQFKEINKVAVVTVSMGEIGHENPANAKVREEALKKAVDTVDGYFTGFSHWEVVPFSEVVDRDPGILDVRKSEKAEQLLVSHIDNDTLPQEYLGEITIAEILKAMGAGGDELDKMKGRVKEQAYSVLEQKIEMNNIASFSGDPVITQGGVKPVSRNLLLTEGDEFYNQAVWATFQDVCDSLGVDALIFVHMQPQHSSGDDITVITGNRIIGSQWTASYMHIITREGSWIYEGHPVQAVIKTGPIYLKEGDSEVLDLSHDKVQDFLPGTVTAELEKLLKQFEGKTAKYFE